MLGDKHGVQTHAYVHISSPYPCLHARLRRTQRPASPHTLLDRMFDGIIDEMFDPHPLKHSPIHARIHNRHRALENDDDSWTHAGEHARAHACTRAPFGLGDPDAPRHVRVGPGRHDGDAEGRGPCVPEAMTPSFRAALDQKKT